MTAHLRIGLLVSLFACVSTGLTPRPALADEAAAEQPAAAEPIAAEAQPAGAEAQPAAANAAPSLVGWLELSGSLQDGPPRFAWAGPKEIGETLPGVLRQLKHVRDEDAFTGMVIYLDQPEITLSVKVRPSM